MKVVTIILVILGIAQYVLGMAQAESAPQQAVVGIQACFLLILARLAQASTIKDVFVKSDRSELTPKE